jgi:putative membrane protein insertion efficiency factor
MRSVGSRSVAVSLLGVPIRGYQAVARGRPSPCRYWPTCSTYALEALDVHGAVRGSWLTVRRLLRCHPWAARSGVDPVPGRAAAPEPAAVPGAVAGAGSGAG